MIPRIEQSTTTRRPARSAGAASGDAADDAVNRRSVAFDDTVKLRAEILREVDVLDQLSVEIAKRDDALLRKYIEMI
ncbi:MAG: hypothetical protein KGM44_07240 [bacterium]|nr:hypothetical protein [bacterium]